MVCNIFLPAFIILSLKINEFLDFKTFPKKLNLEKFVPKQSVQ